MLNIKNFMTEDHRQCDDLLATAFRNPDGSVATVAMNFAGPNQSGASTPTIIARAAE